MVTDGNRETNMVAMVAAKSNTNTAFKMVAHKKYLAMNFLYYNSNTESLHRWGYAKASLVFTLALFSISELAFPVAMLYN